MIYTNVTRIGSKIGFRGYDDIGNRIENKIEFHASFFVNTGTQTEYKDLHGNFVEEIKPGTLWECKEFLEKWKNIDGFSVHGQDNYVVQFISELYNDNPIPHITTDKIKVGYMDIETQCERGFPDVLNPIEEINAITIRVGDTSYVFGVGSFDIKFTDKNYQEFQFSTEEEMLVEFIQLWKLLDIDVVTGWNCKMFDIPYLFERISSLMGPSALDDFSPWKKIWRKNARDDYGNVRPAYTIYGIAILDYMDLYKKYVLAPRESYKLDFIANEELGECKVEWSTLYDSMSEFYQKNFQMFVEYNIVDVDLIVNLEKKLKLLDLHINIAYTALVNYEDAFSPVRVWDAIIYNHLIKDNIVVPFKENAEKSSQYAGAYVKDPKPGMYEWVASFDLASLYPSLIMQYNISPDTIVLRDDLWSMKNNPKCEDKMGSIDTILSHMHGDSILTSVESLLDKGVSSELQDALRDVNIGMAANGYMFTNQFEGFLPHLMDQMFEMRKKMKRSMINSQKELELIKNEMKQRGMTDG